MATPDEPKTEDPAMLDCLVIGGGPAGLTAAIYLARFHLSVTVADEGHSRAALIPKTRNHAGYPEGIAGTDLLVRMREQAMIYGARIEPRRVDSLELHDGRFVARTSAGSILARSILLATGVVNRRPNMPDPLHDQALAVGAVRYCPVCDGYEVTDKAIGVIGSGDRGVNEALFLRSYSRRVTLIAPEGGHDLADAQRNALAQASITVLDGPIDDFILDQSGIIVLVAEQRYSFDSIYPALGSEIRSALAVSVGAEATDEGCLTVDSHQRTSVPGLYAAGDVVQGLDQISHAMGEGGVAATTVRNDLARDHPLYR